MLRMLYRGSITRVSIVSSHTRGLAIARPSSTPPLARLACPRDSKTATLTNSGLFPSPITHLRALNSSCSASQTNNLKMKQPVPNTPADVIAQLPASFAKAKESGDLLFFPSTVHKHSECGVEVFSVLSCFIFCVLADGSPLGYQWEITLCPALQNKPKLPTPHFDAATDERRSLSSKDGKKFDPFSPPYVSNLHLGELKDEEEGEEYVILVRSAFRFLSVSMTSSQMSVAHM
jgi:hypothetical protein